MASKKQKSTNEDNPTGQRLLSFRPLITSALKAIPRRIFQGHRRPSQRGPPRERTPTKQDASEELYRSSGGLDEEDTSNFALLSTKLSQILAIFLGNRSKMDDLLTSFKHDRAQLLLDTLQMLLDVGAHDDDARPPLLNALLTLSQHWELHPQSLDLPDVDRDEDPASDEGFLVLYKACLRNRVVGIKITTVLNPAMQSDLVKQYFREALTWSQLSHPNVQPFYGIHRLKDRLNKVGLVSCWLQNGNVLALLQKIPNIDRSLIVTDVAQGMSYLHSNNIIHGDIRTANVLIRDDDRACLADFGLTSFRAIHDQEDSAFLASISGVGTVRYQAPELFENDDLQRNMATDVFAFSMFCFEIYAGFPPFSEITPWLALMTAIRQGKRPELTASMSRLGGKDSTVLELMRDCWDQNPHRRPSAQHIVARLPLFPPAQSWGVDSSSQVRRGLKSCITAQSVEDTLQSLCSISKS